jgi:hypothetical protein
MLFLSFHKLPVREDLMSKSYESLVGRTFGRVTVVDVSDKSEGGRRYYVCLCDPDLGGCGTVWDVYGHSLVSGVTRSCGCLLKESRSTIGGLRASHPREYDSWYQARRRAQKNEGGMDPEWAASFAAFLTDIGLAPKGTMLQLKRRELGYRPGNCFWRPKIVKEQTSGTGQTAADRSA